MLLPPEVSEGQLHVYVSGLHIDDPVQWGQAAWEPQVLKKTRSVPDKTHRYVPRRLSQHSPTAQALASVAEQLVMPVPPSGKREPPSTGELVTQKP